MAWVYDRFLNHWERIRFRHKAVSISLHSLILLFSVFTYKMRSFWVCAALEPDFLHFEVKISNTYAMIESVFNL